MSFKGVTENTKEARLVRFISAVSGVPQFDIQKVKAVQSEVQDGVRADFIYELELKWHPATRPFFVTQNIFMSDIDDGQPSLGEEDERFLVTWPQG
jgi:hypothetical protein